MSVIFSRIVYRFGYLVVLWALAVCLTVHSADGHAAAKKGKPLPPLQVSIAPADQSVRPENIQPGYVVEFIVTAVALSDAEEMQISVTLPKGAVLKSGELSWSGPVRKHESRSLHFTIKTPDKQNGPIKARAKIQAAEGHAFASEAHYALGSKAKDKPEAQKNTKKTGKGRDVIEYR